MSYDKDSIEATLGRAGEIRVRKWLTLRGNQVIDVRSPPEGGAPLVYGPDGNLPAGDLLVLKAPAIIEVKWKSWCIWYHKKQEWRQGIDLPKWPVYVRLNDQIAPTWLIIYQVRPGRDRPIFPILLIQSITKLKESVCFNDFKMDGFPDGAALWNVQSFKDIPMPTDDVPVELADKLASLARPPLPWERPSKAGHIPSMLDKPKPKPPKQLDLFKVPPYLPRNEP